MKTRLGQLMADTTRNSPGLERHVQSVIQALVLVGVLWLANTANENARQISNMTIHMQNLTEKIVDLKADLNGSVSAEQGRLIEHRLVQLEALVAKHGSDGHGGK